MGVVLNQEDLKVRRSSELEVTDRAKLYEILDSGQVVHVGIIDSASPLVIPLAYVRDGDRILLHGSTGSRLFRKLASEVSVCATVTLLDGLVAARSAFHSAMNYRSVVIFANSKLLNDDEKQAALEKFTNNIFPNRWQEVRPMTKREFAATMVIELSLANMSGKARSGGPSGEDEFDIGFPVWAGEIPIETKYGSPVPAIDLNPEIEPSQSIKSLNE